MRKLIFHSLIILVCLSSVAFAQVGINPTGATPDPSAGLDVDFNNKGFLLPRLTIAQRDAISNPAIGLQVYNTECNNINLYNGSGWVHIPNAAVTLSAQPVAAAICPGANASFSTSSSGVGVTYQWQENQGGGWSNLSDGGVYSNTSTGTMNITSATLAMNGNQYRCLVNGDCGGQATTDVAALTVYGTPAQPGSITGNATPVESGTGEVYSIAAVADATTYTWTVPSGASIVSGQGTTTITVDFGTTTGDICVTPSNPCATGAAQCLSITFAFVCGNNIPVSHTAGSLAPETKIVTYGTVMTNLSGANKCWITKNLGADVQPSGALDASAGARGWFWRFNQLQGYSAGSSSTTPAFPGGSISENSNWVPANDPCTQLFGSDWRLPTAAEWTNVKANGVGNIYDGFNSVLKLHAAGAAGSTGVYLHGQYGVYWSSDQTSTSQANSFSNWTTDNVVYASENKSGGFSVRCLKD